MTDWREELIEKMAKAAWESDGVLNWEGVEFGRKIYLLEARAALDVAEPVIREQCAEMVEKYFGIMAGEATNVKHLEWPRHPYKVMPRHIWNWYWTRTLPRHWRLMRAARAAIREGGNDGWRLS